MRVRMPADAKQGLGGEEQIGSPGQSGQARTAAHGVRSGRGQQGSKLAELGTRMADGRGDGIETLAGIKGSRGQAGGLTLRGSLS